MKKYILVIFIFCLIIISSCFKEKDQIYDGVGGLEKVQVEFQTAITATPAAGQPGGLSYPLIAVARNAGIRSQQVNLVGPQRPADTQIRFVVDSFTTAVAGTHYRLIGDGAFVIPANSSFGQCQVEVLNPARDSGKFVNLILRLEGNGSDITPSENYKRVAYRINLN